MSGESNGDEFAVLTAKLQDGAIETVIFAGVDSHGIMRGKRVPVAQVPRLLEHGMPLCNVFWVMHVDESALVDRPEGYENYFPDRHRGYPDILAVADLGSLRVVPWHTSTALLLCDWHQLDLVPVPIDPRGILKQVVARSQQMDLDPYCGIELEFYVLREDSASLLRKHPADLVPLSDRPSTYGVAKGSEHEPIARLIRSTMLEFGLPIEACNPETGPGQFEITLRYASAFRAADEAFLFKTAVKEVVAQEGLIATFMAKPSTDWPGNSCHLHLSLRDEQGANAFYDAKDPHGISGVMRSFIAGSLSTMSELSAVFGPTINSYRRFGPYCWAATTATWGIDNRSTGIRAICEGEAGTRVEHRRPGGDANLYLATAAALAGGLSGVENGLTPPVMVDDDVYSYPQGSFPELPKSLREAIDPLAESEVARSWLGEDFVGHFIEMKQAEVDAFDLAVTDWEVARYLEAL